jgi:hypothetical protein
MAKSTITVRHKDEIFNELVEYLESYPKYLEEPYAKDNTQARDYSRGYINGLKWTLNMIDSMQKVRTGSIYETMEDLDIEPEPEY